MHPIEVGWLLLCDGQPDEVIVAGLLHDVLEKATTTPAELRRRFGERGSRNRHPRANPSWWRASLVRERSRGSRLLPLVEAKDLNGREERPLHGHNACTNVSLEGHRRHHGPTEGIERGVGLAKLRPAESRAEIGQASMLGWDIARDRRGSDCHRVVERTTESDARGDPHDDLASVLA